MYSPKEKNMSVVYNIIILSNYMRGLYFAQSALKVIANVFI